MISLFGGIKAYKIYKYHQTLNEKYTYTTKQGTIFEDFIKSISINATDIDSKNNQLTIDKNQLYNSFITLLNR